jgi:hypothetical protein
LPIPQPRRAHEFGTKVTRAYDRDDEVNKRRELMTAWSNFIGAGGQRLVANVA